MKQALFTLLVAFASSTQIFGAFENPKLKQAYTRSDAEYIGPDITCADAAYCTFQQSLYNATMADNLALAPRYVVD